MKKKISKRFLTGFFAVALSLSLGATAMALGPQAQPDGSMPGPAGPDAPTGEQPPESTPEDAAFPGGGQPAPDGPGAPSIEQPPMAGPDAFPGPASPGAPPQA